MHLQKLKLSNFRSFDAVEIPLFPDLTIFVGENNGGKSNAIDAIRLVTTPLAGRREIYCEGTDIRFGSISKKFELEAHFAELSVPQQGRFISAAMDPSLSRASFGIVYDASKGSFPIRPLLWAGHLRTKPEAGCHEGIRHVYLPPLRDAKRALTSGNPTRILALLNHFLDGSDPDVVAKDLARSIKHEILDKVDNAVDIGLKALTTAGRRQAASIGFAAEEKLIDIARDLRFKLADHGVQLQDLQYSGHGYANLLYIATIAVELEKVNNADLTVFLVEEPEAHLHPQLQAAVLCFLEEQAEKSRKPRADPLGPAGELQVVVATHSPNLSAWVECQKIVAFKSGIDYVPIPPGGEGTAPYARISGSRVTRCVPLASLELDEKHRRKIDRYLDVTRSAFLFGGRVCLVEGIAEALLVPAIAKKHVLKDDIEKYRLFRSSVFVPIDGVDFEPYVRLLLAPWQGTRISDRVVVATDGDQGSRKPGKDNPGDVRKKRLARIVDGLGATDAFAVITNTYSLETELVRAGNSILMKKIYIKLRRNSGAKWDAAVAKTGNDQALAVQTLFANARKGDFAQLLAEAISNGEEFTVPEYIRAMIAELVK